MADISKITLPSGSTYDIKDAVARAAIAGGMLAFVGVPSKLYSGDTGTTEVPTTTGTGAFADGNTTVKRVKLAAAANIRGTSYAAGDVYTIQNGDTIIVGNKEYVATVATSGNSTTVTWHEFGDTTTLGDWAKWNAGQVTFTPSGSVSINLTGDAFEMPLYVGNDGPSQEDYKTHYTPSGTVSQPTFTGSSTTSTGSYTPAGSVSLTNTNKTAAVAPANSGENTYTPAGSVSQPTFSGSSLTSTGKFTPEGTVTTNTTENKTATVSAASSGTTTYTPAGTVSQPTFTGSAMTSTGTFTATGSVAITATENKTATVSSTTGTATYTPAGSVAAPTISVATAGSTTTVNSATKKTVVTDMAVAEPSSTTATGELVYFSVSNETLTLKKFVETTGDSVTTESKTVKTGDAAYSATAPAFTGTGVRLVTGNIAVPKTLSFTGTEDQAVSVSGTPTGTVSQLTFSGTAVRLVTGNIAVPKTYSFVGTEGDVSVTGTPTGTVSQPTFTGTGVRLVTGNISVPSSASFSGTAATISVTGTPSGTVSQPTFTGTEVALSAKINDNDFSGTMIGSFTGTQQSVNVTKVS